MARPEEKGRHYSGQERGWQLAWQSPQGHTPALPKVRRCPRQSGVLWDRTPMAPRKQGPEQRQAVTPGALHGATAAQGQ